jgi:hypothetical protein
VTDLRKALRQSTGSIAHVLPFKKNCCSIYSKLQFILPLFSFKSNLFLALVRFIKKSIPIFKRAQGTIKVSIRGGVAGQGQGIRYSGGGQGDVEVAKSPVGGRG